jgi:hypothetical protein
MAMKPVNWSAVSAIAHTVMALATIGAFIFAGVQIQDLREEAKIHHLMEQVNTFDGPRYTEIRKSLAIQRMDTKQERLQKLDPDNPPTALYDELNFCEDLGLLSRHGSLNLHDVYEEFSYWLLPVYTDARPVIDASRKESPSVYVNCVWLVDSIRSIENKEGAGADDHPSETAIYEFYAGEVSIQPGQPRQKGRHSAKSGAQ